MIIKGGVGAQTVTGTSSADTIYGGDTSDPSATTGNITVTRLLDTNDDPLSLAAPLFVTHAPGDANGLYIVQKGGDILRFDLAAQTVTTFLDISADDLNQSGSEQGLLGFAFHPDYATNDKFYVTVTRTNGDVQVREYTHSGAATTATNINTRDNIITIDHSQGANHNGGWLGFHPTTGLLYIAVGDGGGAGDPEGDAQNVNSLLGKILRIDVDSAPDAGKNYHVPASNPYVGEDGALGEIFASGLRNPWRNSFDAAGNLWIADVGQREREEVNFIAANSNGGQNFGWNVREGTLPYAGGLFGSGTVTGPIFQYSHLVGNSITGGYVYHGPGAGLQGAYVFGDFGSGRIFALENDGAVTSVDLSNALSQDISSLASFGEDAAGNLYAVDIFGGGGTIYRITPSAGAGDGNDVINAGAGNDKVYGGLGNDTLNGEAGIDSLIGGVGNDILNGGTSGDYMNGGGGNDTYVVDFSSDKVVEAASSGLDRINSSITYTLPDNVESLTLTGTAAITATGNNGANYLGGNAASNGLNGRDGNDTLSGNAGNDLLSGGRGDDVLIGGAGSDAFLFNTTPGAGNVDAISDFNVAADTIRLDDSVYSALGAPGVLSAGQFRIGAAAADSNDHVIYNSSTGALIYDLNGNVGGGAVQFATLAAGLALTNQDFLIV